MTRRHRTTRPNPPTAPYKAYAALLTSLAAAVGVQLTSGTAELVVAIVALAVNAFAVWRTPNPIKGRRDLPEQLRGRP